MGAGKITSSQFLRSAYRLVDRKDKNQQLNEMLIGIHEAVRMSKVMDQGLFDLSQSLIVIAKQQGVHDLPSKEQVPPPVKAETSPVISLKGAALEPNASDSQKPP